MSIAVARYASGKRATVGWFTVVAWCTGFAELANIAIRAGALLNVAHLIVAISWPSRLQLHIVKESHPS